MAVDNSKIEWTDSTWSPVTGCTKVSPGCDNCYAETIAHRFAGQPAFPNGFAVTLRPERLDQPIRWTRPRRIFVNSMSDLFHEAIDDDYIARVFAVMAMCARHTFQVLSKRHARMRALLRNPDFQRAVAEHLSDLMASRRWRRGQVDLVAGTTPETVGTTQIGAFTTRDTLWTPPWPLPNVHLGVSVETQKWANIRVPALLDTPAAVRWLSCEPLLGRVDLTWCDGVDALEPDWNGYTGAPHPLIDWVVCGGESGHGARPMHPDWARSLRDQCARAGVPFHFKQHGQWKPLGPVYGDDDESDDARMDAVMEEIDGHRVIELETDGYIPEGHQPGDPRTWLMASVGKKRAGRELDGRTHDAYPTAAVTG